MAKMKITKSDMSYLEDSGEVEEVFDELPPEMDSEVPDSDIKAELDDIITEEVVSEDRFEFYVSGTQPLNLGDRRFLPGDVVPQQYADAFLVTNGHISKRKVLS